MKEKRNYPRIKASCSMVYSKDIYPKSTVASTVNLSEGGAKIQTLYSLDKDETLEISIAIAGQVIKSRGKVIHVVEREDGKIEAGIQFQELSEMDKFHLRQYLFQVMEMQAISSLSMEKTLQ